MKLSMFAVVLACVVMTALPARGQPLPPQRDKAIRKLLAVTRADEAANATKAQMQNQLRTMWKNVPESFWTEFFRTLDGNELTTKLVAIYAKHFSDKEVADLLAFYESPLGKKLVATQPLLVQDSSAAGAEWGRAVAERVMKRLKEKGYLDGGGAKK